MTTSLVEQARTGLRWSWVTAVLATMILVKDLMTRASNTSIAIAIVLFVFTWRAVYLGYRSLAAFRKLEEHRT